MASIRATVAGRAMSVVFPEEFMASERALFEAERAEFEAVFGAPVIFTDERPRVGPCWLVEVDASAAANQLIWDEARLTLTSHVRDAEGWAATVQMLHSLVTLSVERLCDEPAPDLCAAMRRSMLELERGFPGFDIRDLSWRELREGLPPVEEMSVSDLARLAARLQDGHTGVFQDQEIHHPPYAVSLAGAVARFDRVAPWSTAAAAGVEPGWTMQLTEAQTWLETVGAPPHALPWIAGRRAIALRGEPEREFTATSPTGSRSTWTEAAQPHSQEHLFESRVLSSNAVYVRLQNWIEGQGLDEQLDTLLHDHHGRKLLVLDLRGNTGGSLMMAQRWRRRFLRQRTLLGTIQFTRADGTLATPVPLWDEPPAEGTWHGQLLVLTDPLTFSASEDFLHGLQGQEHVKVAGWTSGGGSGRPRTVPVVPGQIMTISTALTFDRAHRCIEGNGIPVDIPMNPFAPSWAENLRPYL